MEESLENATDELKRAEHLMYVSLKYTRTVDMIRHLVEKLISIFDYGVMSLLEYAKEKKKIKEYPPAHLSRCRLLEKTFKNVNIDEYLTLYLFLRKLTKIPYTKREEYRRHVTMICQSEEGEIKIDIDILEEYYAKTTDFIKLIISIIKEENKR